MKSDGSFQNPLGLGRRSPFSLIKDKKLDFGCGVVHDQERCVVCGRCVRFCRQITKTGELGIINRTDTARVNVFPGRPLNNRYALNVVDLCPVGAMTSTDFRFKQRVWFLKKAPGICHGCSKGCNITIDHNREKYKDDVIYRFRPLLNEQVNGYFMCDEGRLSYRGENEGRLTEPRLSRQSRPLEDVLTACAKAIEKAERITIVVSPNCSLEQMVTVKALAEKLGMAGKFNILFAGGMGKGQALAKVLDAAALLKDKEQIMYDLLYNLYF